MLREAPLLTDCWQFDLSPRCTGLDRRRCAARSAPTPQTFVAW